MEREVATLAKGARCCGWNYCSRRLAVGHDDGTVSVHDCPHPASFASSPSSVKWIARSSGVANVVWVPPEFGDAIACICDDGTLSLWEEVEEEDDRSLKWRICTVFESTGSQVLDLQFRVSGTNLKLVSAYSDGFMRVYECLDPLELSKWQLQAEFHNVIDLVTRYGKPSCLSASIAWCPGKGESHPESFVVGCSTDLAQFNSPKVWQFEEAHQRWIPVAELALPEDKGDRVHAVAWAPNIGRPCEVVAVATCKGIAIWHLSPDSDGGLSTDKVALLAGHDGEIWQLEWDMSGMTLASTGGDGMARLWQSNLNGVWQEQAALDCNGSPE